MGTLERIRQTSPYLLAAFAIIFIAFFVISDMDPSTLKRGNMFSENISIINGDPIVYKEFEAKARQLEEQQRDAARNNPKAQQPEPTQIRAQLYSQLLDETLMRQEAQKAGCNVTEGQLLDRLLENPPQEVKQMFTDNSGKFDKAFYQNVITKPEAFAANRTKDPKQKAELIKTIRDIIQQTQETEQLNLLYQNLITLVSTSGTVVSPLFAQENIKTDADSASVDFIALDVTTIKDDEVKVTDEDLKKYYEENKQFYQQREQKRIKYAIFPIVASKADSDAATKKVSRIFESLNLARGMNKVDSVFKERLRDNPSEIIDFTDSKQLNPRIASILTTIPDNDFAGPIPAPEGFMFFYVNDKRSSTNEEVKASHILVKFGSDSLEAMKKIKEALAKVKSGADFAEVAKEYSQDGSAQKGGDLGFFKKGQMVKEFDEAAFGAKVDELVGPIRTQFGYHIIKVTEKKSEPLDEIAYSQIVIKPQISKQAKKQIIRSMNDIVFNVEKNGMLFDTAVVKSQKRPMMTPFFTRDRQLPGFASQYIVLKAFESQKGQFIGPWEDRQLGYVIAYVSDERKAGMASFEDKKDDIKPMVIKLKKLDMLKVKAEQLLAEIQQKGGNLATLKADSTLGIKTLENIKNNGSMQMFGKDNVFTQKVYMQPLNQLSAPIRGERAYYIIQVNARTETPVPDFKSITMEQITAMANSVAQQVYNNWFGKIKEEANIEDHRLEIWGENL